MIAAITCARMGSTRFHGKCLATLGGQPLLQYTVDFALALGLQLYVWTRDQEILDFASDKCPVIYEPKWLYDTDYNSTFEKMRYANEIIQADFLVLLQPTHPMRSLPAVRAWLAALSEPETDYARSVILGTEESSGSFYAYSRHYLQTRFMRRERLCYENRPYDIDTPTDLERCEACLRA
jgi:CMP-N-acetylneuraminic acid synthetase